MLTITDRDRPAWAPGLLGLDWLGRHRQEYDFKHGLARFSPVDPQRPPSWTTWSASQ
jgi:hypothetical protein